MTHYYFCTPEESNEILKNIREEDEYVASVFENRIEIDFVTPQDFINVSFDKYLIDYSVGDPILIKFSNAYKNVFIQGYFDSPDIYKLASNFGFTEKYLQFIESSLSYSCPLKIVSKMEKTIRLNEWIKEVGKNRVVTNDW